MRYTENKMTQRIMIFALAFLVFAGPGPTGTPAAAQSSRDLAEQLDRIERQLRAVQRRVFGETGVEDSQAAASAAAADRAVLADIRISIQQLESEIRKLTGRIEEIQHGQDLIRRDLERFKRDADLRLRDLETAGTGADDSDAEGEADTETATEASETEAEVTPGERAPEGVDVAGLDAPAGGPGTLPEGTPAEQYDYAFGFMMRGDYAAAEQSFQAFLEEHPDHELSGNAQYWLGESHYVRQDYARALEAFLAGYQQHADSNKGPDNLIKLGLTLVNMGEEEDACAAFREFEIRYPDAGSNLQSIANRQIEELGCS